MGSLLALPANELLRKFGASSHKPGSGSAAALQGLLAAQLLRTVIGLTNDEKRRRHYRKTLSSLLENLERIESDIYPALENLLQRDSVQFDKVIKLRKAKEAESDADQKKALAADALRELKPATEIPIEIGKLCITLAEFALETFDNAFKSARGDSGVALSAAISAVSGCLSIIDLNLLSFESDDWTSGIRAELEAMRARLGELEDASRDRRTEQKRQSEQRNSFFLELKQLGEMPKSRNKISDADIESLAVKLQRLMWLNRRLIWKRDVPKNPLDVLRPEMALELLKFEVKSVATLGEFELDGVRLEVAAEIDQIKRSVLVSERFPLTRNFTVAHELGHALLHEQPVLHRDRPLEGPRLAGVRDLVEFQADRFATFFLMPRKVVIRQFKEFFLSERFVINENTAFALGESTSDNLYGKCRNKRGLATLLASAGLFNQVHFRSLSEQFGVSVEAMAIRLEELDLFEF